MKRKIIYSTMAVLVLVICYVIGQTVVKPNRTDIEYEDVYYNYVLKSEELMYEGYVETADMPGGKTVGLVEDEVYGKWYLLTPNTSITAGIILDDVERYLYFEYCIHNNVSHLSDGIQLNVQIVQEGTNEILFEECLVVDREEREYAIDLSAWKNSNVFIKFQATNPTDDETGDWLVIKDAFIDEISKNIVVEDINKNVVTESATNDKKTDDSDNDTDSVIEESNKDNTILSYEEKSWVYNDVELEITTNHIAPVLEQGADGEWDDVDCLNPSVVYYNNEYYNYYSGYDGDVWSTGLATSEDGLVWKKHAKNPVLWVGQDGLDNDYIAANGSAIIIDNKVYYYYQGNSEAGAYISLAVSEDGVNFQKQGEPILIGSGIEGEWDCSGVADPYVIEHNDVYYMYYLGINEVGIQRLGLATSTDGTTWSRSISNPILDVGSVDSFDENGLGEPSVVYYAPYFYMIYTGRDSAENRNIGYALSTDGINWRKYSIDGMLDEASEWNSKVICDTTFILDTETGLLNVWYGGGNVASPDENLNGKVGYFNIDLSNDRDATKIDNAVDDRDDLRDLLKGAHIEEDKIWATSRTSFTLLNKSGSEELVFDIYVPYEMHMENDIKSFDVNIYVNGSLAKEVSFNESNIYEINVPIECESEWINVTLESNSEVKTDGDERYLSYIINSIYQQ